MLILTIVPELVKMWQICFAISGVLSITISLIISSLVGDGIKETIIAALKRFLFSMTMLSIVIIMMITIALTEQFILAFVVVMVLLYTTYRQDAYLKLMFFPN